MRIVAEDEPIRKNEREKRRERRVEMIILKQRSWGVVVVKVYYM
jgi:hypothetical protein